MSMQPNTPRPSVVRAKIAMRRTRGELISAPLIAPLRRRIDWGVLGAAVVGGALGYLAGFLTGVTW